MRCCENFEFSKCNIASQSLKDIRIIPKEHANLRKS